MMDKELYLRKHQSDSEYRKKLQTIYYKRVESMTSQEIDSLRKLPNGKDTIVMEKVRKEGIGMTTAEVEQNIFQELAMEKGLYLNLHVLDSLFADSIKASFAYHILLYNQDSLIIDSIGDFPIIYSAYTSGIRPIGIKGLRYIQLKANIPLVDFIRLQIWPLLLSICFMLCVMLCMGYHLIVIRRKDNLVQKREETINGTVHDLKSPLNGVLTTLGWIKPEENNAAKKKAVEICQAEVKHMVCNIESLLVTVRKDKKKLILKKEAIDILHLTEVVKNSLDSLYCTKPHTIEIVNELPEGLQVCVDRMYIENVIRNLVENALKYSDDGVTVKVVQSVADGMLQVSVQDDGWGIAPQYQKKLFRQFYQVPRGEERIRKGYGIGLAQSKYIVDEHKGKITVKSAEGKGSTFTFVIPLA